MKRRTPPPGPGASDREVGDFWQSHSAADYWKGPARSRRVAFTLRLDARVLRLLQAVARDVGVPYTALARNWIMDRLQQERRAR